MVKRHLSLVQEIQKVIDNDSFYLLDKYDYMYFLMKRKPYVLPWTQHFPWLLNPLGGYDPIIKRLENQKIKYIVLSQENTPLLFLSYINKTYDHVHTLSDGGWIMRRREL